MLGPLDHVGYLVRDLDAAVAAWAERFALEVVRPVELPQYSILGKYLGQGSGSVEMFTITDEQLLAERLGEQRIVLDHAAYEVADIDAVAAAMHERGVRFCGPDRREEVSEPILLGGGVRHLWTVPHTSFGQSLQLLQR
ncbi:MAG TPA: VOC family protein [Solirubrobacteraceae bacterium]|nr:VOC family protein [Solirubrobacteraceae bacterium]